MPDHVIEQGECLSSVAAQYNFDWQTLWNHPQNADLKNLRKDPNVLYPGDVVFVPDVTPKKASCATGYRHRFVQKGAVETLRIKFLDGLDRPQAQLDYELVIDGEHRTGTTNDDGEVVEKVSPDTTDATLIVGAGDEQVELELHIGVLDPADTITGAQARLTNLGFDPGPLDGVLGPLTTQAIQDFQDAYELDTSGELDDATVSALRDRHGR